MKWIDSDIILEDEEEEEVKGSDYYTEVLNKIWSDIPSVAPEDDEEDEEEEEEKVDLVDDETIEFDEAPEPAEEFELIDQETTEPKVEPRKAPKKVYEDPYLVTPTMATITSDQIASNLSEVQRNRIDRLSDLLSSHGVDINNYDPKEVAWRDWPQDDIREYNNLINYLKFDSHDWAKAPAQKEVDPYAMAQVSIDLWPDVAIGDTTIRQAIKDILHTGDPNAWAEAEKGTEKYATLKQLYAATIQYYRMARDKTSQLDVLHFLNEYSEHNSETGTGKPMGLTVGLWKISGTDTYMPLSFKEAERAKKLAKQKKMDQITITRKGKEIPIEPILVDPAEIKPRLSFAPRSGRRVIDDDGWKKPQKVGALNNAIVNLFSSPNFDPKNTDAKIDWEAIANLEAPLNFYVNTSHGIRGNYLLGWEDGKLLKLYRMFRSALPSTARYDDQIRALQDELENTKDEQRRRDINNQIDELQDKIDNPPSPNREEWDRNYANGKPYPTRIISPSDRLEKILGRIGNIYLYKYVGPNPDANKPFVRSPRKMEGLSNYELVGPMKEVVGTGVVGELKKIEDMVDKGHKQLEMQKKGIPEVEESGVELEPDLTEGIITTPAIIIVNGSPFKLRLGDRLIIDNIKEVNSPQK